MTDEVREYAERKIWESGVRRAPGYYPHFKTKEDEIPEINSIDIQRYKDLLWKLKKNEDNVPLEILRTKYREAYNSLRQELKEMTIAIIHEVVYRDLYIERTDEKRMILAINQAIMGSEIYGSINKAIYQEKCYENIISSVMRLRRIVQEAIEKEFGDGQAGREKDTARV